MNPRLWASFKNCSFVVVVVIAFCVLVYGAKVLRKKLKKIYLLLFFNFLLLYACAGCAGAPGLAVVALVALRLRLLWWSLVFGGAALVLVVSLVLVLRLWCILCYFANLGKMGAHIHTRAHTYTRNNF